MISSKVRIFIYILLAVLVVWDIGLSVSTIFFPDFFFKVAHGAPYIDPQGLIKRTGAVWAAFVLLQTIAIFRWEKATWWLVLIAGVRMTELFSDWVYICVAESWTTIGRVTVFTQPPMNLAIGLFLIWAYKKIMKSRGC